MRGDDNLNVNGNKICMWENLQNSQWVMGHGSKMEIKKISTIYTVGEGVIMIP